MTKAWLAAALLVLSATSGWAGEILLEPGEAQVSASTCTRVVRGTSGEPRLLVLDCPDNASSNSIYYSFSYPVSTGTGWTHSWSGSLLIEPAGTGRYCFSVTFWVINETNQSLSSLSPTSVVSFYSRAVSVGEVGTTVAIPLTSVLTTFGQNSIPVHCTSSCRQKRAVVRLTRVASASCSPGPAATADADLQGLRLHFD